MITIKVKKLVDHAVLPAFSTPGSAAVDLKAIVPYRLQVGDRKVIPLGISIEIPKGHYMAIVPRSGLAAKQGITITNSPGIIDSDYRGELGVILQNTGTEPLEIKPGDRICQALVLDYPEVCYVEVDELSSTERGAGGFGSTGK